MTEIQERGSTLSIDGKQIDLPEEILDTVVLDDRIFVLFEQGDMDPRNLIAIDYSGATSWRVPVLENIEGNPSSISMIKESDGDLLIYTGSKRYKLDPGTEEIEYLGWYRG